MLYRTQSRRLPGPIPVCVGAGAGGGGWGGGGKGEGNMGRSTHLSRTVMKGWYAMRDAVMGGADHAGAAAALGGLFALFVGAGVEGHGEASFGGRYVFGVEMVRWMCEGGLEDGLVDTGRCWMWKEEEERKSREDLF